MASLLWIVKTSQSKSLSHSDEFEQLQVYSHAQRNSRRPKMAKHHRSTRTEQQVVKHLVREKKKPNFDSDSDLKDNPSTLLGQPSHISSNRVLGPHSDWPVDELRGFNYFLEVSIYKIITLERDIDFWKGLVPRLAESYPGFRHLVVAIASTFELLYSPDSTSCNDFALIQCNKAINLILSAKNPDMAWLLTSCILISAYSLLRSDVEAADISIESGLKMISSERNSCPQLYQLSRILNSLAKQHGFKLWAPDVTFKFERTTAGREPLVINPAFTKGPFFQLEQVLAAFKTLMIDLVTKLMRNLSLGAHIDPKSSLARDVCRHFADVFFHLDAYDRSLAEDEADQKLKLMQLQIGLQSAYVLFTTRVLASNENEVDAHTYRFSKMLQLGQRVIAARHAGLPVIYLDRIVNGALYTAAMFCRNSSIRQHLITLLQSQLIYEDGLVNYLRSRVVEIITEYEENGFQRNGCYDIPGNRLIRLVALQFSEDRTIGVHYMYADELDRRHPKLLRASLGVNRLEKFTVREIDDCLKGMTATYSMYGKVENQVAPDGYLRQMYYRGQPVPIRWEPNCPRILPKKDM